MTAPHGAHLHTGHVAPTVLRMWAPVWLWIAPALFAVGAAVVALQPSLVGTARWSAVGALTIAAVASLVIVNLRRSSITVDGSLMTVADGARPSREADLARVAAVGMVGSRGGGILVLIGPWRDGPAVPRHAGLPSADVAALRQAGHRSLSIPPIRVGTLMPLLAQHILTRPGVLLSEGAFRALSGASPNPPSPRTPETPRSDPHHQLTSTNTKEQQ